MQETCVAAFVFLVALVMNAVCRFAAMGWPVTQELAAAINVELVSLSGVLEPQARTEQEHVRLEM